MARTAALLALPLLALLFAGCTDPGHGGDDTLARWEAEAARHGAMGYEATLDLQGPVLHVMTEGVAREMRAPLTLWFQPDPFEPERAFLFVRDAAVAGHGSGLLVVEVRSPDPDERASLRVSAGSLRDMPLRGAGAGQFAVLRPQLEAGSPPPLDVLPPGSEAQGDLVQTRLVPATLRDWTVDAAASARLYTSTGNVSLGFPLTFSGTGLWWNAGREDAVVGDRATLDLGRFVLFGDVREGAVRPRGREPLAAPLSVVGHALALDLAPQHARSLAPFRLTQAMTAGGELAFPARVEVAPSAAEIRLERGEERWVALRVREASYAGDAVLSRVTVHNAPADMVEVPVERPPLLLDQMMDVVMDIGREVPWAAPFFAVGVAALSPALLFADVINVLRCAFQTCPEEFPFPSWMDAGHVGTSYVKLTGTEPGTFGVQVVIEGQNYAAVTVPLTVHVA